MAAPSGLLVAWVIVAFVSSHAASYVAHCGQLSALWVAGYAVSLVVPIWSDCHTVAVAVALAIQGSLSSFILSGVPTVLDQLQNSSNNKPYLLNFSIVALTGLNYLVWLVSNVLTTPNKPTTFTLVGAVIASVALFILAEAVRIIQEKHNQKKGV